MKKHEHICPDCGVMFECDTRCKPQAEPRCLKCFTLSLNPKSVGSVPGRKRSRAAGTPKSAGAVEKDFLDTSHSHLCGICGEQMICHCDKPKRKRVHSECAEGEF